MNSSFNQSRFRREHEDRLEMLGAGTLVIKSVTEEDRGVYTCRAVNQDDTADADAALNVIGMF